MSNETIIEQIRETGDPDRALIWQLYDQNRPLIKQFVMPYVKAGLELDDAMQQAYFAIVQAVEHFDQSAGALFITCLQYWIRATVGRELKNTAHIKRIPAHMQERIARYKKLCQEHEAATGRGPSDAFICKNLDISAEQLANMRRALYEADTISLAAPLPGLDDQAATLEDTIADPADQIQEATEQIAREQAARELWAAVDSLEDEQTEVIKIRYIEQQTRQAAAERLNRTPARIQKAEQRALKNLRRNRIVKQIGFDFGYSSKDLFGGSLSSFKAWGTSAVEHAVLKRLGEL